MPTTPTVRLVLKSGHAIDLPAADPGRLIQGIIASMDGKPTSSWHVLGGDDGLPHVVFRGDDLAAIHRHDG